MKIEIFAVFDNKLGAYLVPQFYANSAIAERACMLSMQHGNFETPQDYTLYKIGTWDDVNAEIETHKPEYVRRFEELIDESRTKEIYNLSTGGTR